MFRPSCIKLISLVCGGGLDALHCTETIELGGNELTGEFAPDKRS